LRLKTNSVDVAKAIPTAEKKQAQGIRGAFASAEAIYQEHNSEPLLRAHDNFVNGLKKYKLMNRVAATDPGQCEKATWAMHATRREAACLAATLTKRLSDKLLADLKATTEALEDELDAKGIPVSESHFDSPSYVMTYTCTATHALLRPSLPGPWRFTMPVACKI
jgi:hypothetical protein